MFKGYFNILKLIMFFRTQLFPQFEVGTWFIAFEQGRMGYTRYWTLG